MAPSRANDTSSAAPVVGIAHGQVDSIPGLAGHPFDGGRGTIPRVNAWAVAGLRWYTCDDPVEGVQVRLQGNQGGDDGTRGRQPSREIRGRCPTTRPDG